MITSSELKQNIKDSYGNTHDTIMLVFQTIADCVEEGEYTTTNILKTLNYKFMNAVDELSKEEKYKCIKSYVSNDFVKVAYSTVATDEEKMAIEYLLDWDCKAITDNCHCECFLELKRLYKK